MLTWNVTRSCNLRCSYCAPNAPFGKPAGSERDRLRILDAILALNPIFVSLLGGEPTLVPEISTLIHRLIEHDVHADLTTNGAGVNDDFCRNLEGFGSSRYTIMLSLDSNSPETNDAQRGPGSFKTAIRAARRMGSYDLPFAVGMTITPKNMHDLVETYELAAELGARFFCAWFVMPSGRATRDHVASPDEEFVRQVKTVVEGSQLGGPRLSRLDLSYSSMRHIRDSMGSNHCQSVTPQLAEAASMIGCEGCRYRILVDENGDVYPCDFLQYSEFKMGNLLDDPWDDVWNSPPAVLKARLTRSAKPGCQSCALTVCDTGCFGITYAEFKRSGKLLPMCEV
ncbi:MAG: radical SAM protein [Propionibacteriaceae bacterium]|nr:radical SAM protein [Propionibacteriaceae bacterium]